MSQSLESMLPANPAWFCVRTQPKREHIAAAQLRQAFQIEVFLPCIRFQRSTRTGPAWVTEALFLNYLFARFNLNVYLRRVKSARGVRGVVHFGDRWPTIPDPVIDELRAAIGPTEIKILRNEFQTGDPVEITSGALHGLQAVVSHAMSGQKRVAVLLDFLGRQTSVEVDRHLLVRRGENRPDPDIS